MRHGLCFVTRGYNLLNGGSTDAAGTAMPPALRGIRLPAVFSCRCFSRFRRCRVCQFVRRVPLSPQCCRSIRLVEGCVMDLVPVAQTICPPPAAGIHAMPCGSLAPLHKSIRRDRVQSVLSPDGSCRSSFRCSPFPAPFPKPLPKNRSSRSLTSLRQHQMFDEGRSHLSEAPGDESPPVRRGSPKSDLPAGGRAARGNAAGRHRRRSSRGAS